MGNSALSSQIGSHAHQRYIKAATTDNTRRAYQSAIRHFERWGGVLPSNPKTVMGYLLAHAQSLSTRTLSLRLTALKNWHELQGFDNPVTDEVKKLLKGIEREEGKPKQKAAVFTFKELQLLIEHIDDDLKGRRDKALILVGFFGAFRRSELVGVTVENIKKVEEGIVITVPRSKTDQEGEGEELTVIWQAINVEHQCHYCIPAHTRYCSHDESRPDNYRGVSKKQALARQQITNLV